MNAERTSECYCEDPDERWQEECVYVPTTSDSPCCQTTAEGPSLLRITNHGEYDQCGGCGRPADQHQQDEQMQLAGETASSGEKPRLKRPSKCRRQGEEEGKLVTHQRSPFGVP